MALILCLSTHCENFCRFQVKRNILQGRRMAEACVFLEEKMNSPLFCLESLLNVLFKVNEIQLKVTVHESFMTLEQQIKMETKEAVLTEHSARTLRSIKVGKTDSPLHGILNDSDSVL